MVQILVEFVLGSLIVVKGNRLANRRYEVNNNGILPIMFHNNVLRLIKIKPNLDLFTQ